MYEVEHTWTTSSQHRTSQGLVSYQRCHCGLRRITLAEQHVLADRVGAHSPSTEMPRGPAQALPSPGPDQACP